MRALRGPLVRHPPYNVSAARCNVLVPRQDSKEAQTEIKNDDIDVSSTALSTVSSA